MGAARRHGFRSIRRPLASSANRKTVTEHQNYELFMTIVRACAVNRPHAEENAVSMTCREAIDVLADYLDQVLSPALAEQLDAHLRDCPPCLAYLKTYRKTRDLVGQAGQVEMPQELKARLRRFLLEQLGGGKG